LWRGTSRKPPARLISMAIFTASQGPVYIADTRTSDGPLSETVPFEGSVWDPLSSFSDAFGGLWDQMGNNQPVIITGNIADYEEHNSVTIDFNGSSHTNNGDGTMTHTIQGPISARKNRLKKQTFSETSVMSFTKKSLVGILVVIILLLIATQLIPSSSLLSGKTPEPGEKIVTEKKSGYSQSSKTRPLGNAEQPEEDKITKKHQITGGGPSAFEQSVKITEGSYAVLRKLKEEELRRSTLIEQTEKDGTIQYVFRIRRADDFEKLLTDTCKSVSSELQINYSALRTARDNDFSVFDIPPNSHQEVVIKVPLDATKPISFTSAVRTGGDTDQQHFGIGKVTTGSVKKEATGWRYNNLLEMAAPQ
jgi:hypothetical protein